MIKLVLHSLVIAAITLVGRTSGRSLWLIVPAAFVGAGVVHFVFEWWFGGTRHLGAVAIAEDDPVMLAAFEESKRTWPEFLRLYAERPQDSLVKFRLRTDDGEIENVWGDLLQLQDDVAAVYLRTPPAGPIELDGHRLSVPVKDIVDWQVMLTDETLCGGFTQQATFRIIEREQGTLPTRLSKQLDRYREIPS